MAPIRNKVYRTVEEWQVYLERDVPYDGYVIGLGYAYTETSQIRERYNPDQSRRAMETFYEAAQRKKQTEAVNVFIDKVVWHQYLITNEKEVQDSFPPPEVPTRERITEAIEKWNEYIKQLNSAAENVIQLARQFNRSNPNLNKAWKNAKRIGGLNIAIDVGLMVEDMTEGEPWGWHAYDAAIGAVSMAGPVGIVAAYGIDAIIQGGRWMGERIYEINTRGPQMIIRQIVRGY
jgi:hypothetical protein